MDTFDIARQNLHFVKIFILDGVFQQIPDGLYVWKKGAKAHRKKSFYHNICACVDRASMQKVNFSLKYNLFRAIRFLGLKPYRIISLLLGCTLSPALYTLIVSNRKYRKIQNI